MQPTIDVTAVRNIWAIGRNYGEHAKELGNAVPVATQDPLIFLKAGSCLVENGGVFHLPIFSAEPAYELEVALQFGADLEFRALSLAIDVTLRDVQTKLKAQAHPWTLAKSFKQAALIGPAVALTTGLDPQNLEFRLKINGELRQKGHTADMIHKIASIRRYVLERFPVVAGDLLFTGTPAGVGTIRPGDVLEAEIPGIITANWRAAR